MTGLPVLADACQEEDLVVHGETEPEGDEAGDDEGLHARRLWEAEVAVLEEP